MHTVNWRVSVGACTTRSGRRRGSPKLSSYVCFANGRVAPGGGGPGALAAPVRARRMRRRPSSRPPAARSRSLRTADTARSPGTPRGGARDCACAPATAQSGRGRPGGPRRPRTDSGARAARWCVRTRSRNSGATGGVECWRSTPGTLGTATGSAHRACASCLRTCALCETRAHAGKTKDWADVCFPLRAHTTGSREWTARGLAGCHTCRLPVVTRVAITSWEWRCMAEARICRRSQRSLRPLWASRTL